MNHQASTGEVLRFTEATAMPATKQELINTAVTHNATDDVLAVLDLIPEREYASNNDLAKELDRVV